MTPEEAIECITKALPDPGSISKWDLGKAHDDDPQILFSWRGIRFKLWLKLSMLSETTEDGINNNTNLSAVISALIKREYMEMEAKESADSGV